jgi:hypothetical protein
MLFSKKPAHKSFEITLQHFFMKLVLKPSDLGDFLDGKFVTILSISSFEKGSPDDPKNPSVQLGQISQNAFE